MKKLLFAAIAALASATTANAMPQAEIRCYTIDQGDVFEVKMLISSYSGDLYEQGISYTDGMGLSAERKNSSQFMNEGKDLFVKFDTTGEMKSDADATGILLRARLGAKGKWVGKIHKFEVPYLPGPKKVLTARPVECVYE